MSRTVAQIETEIQEIKNANPNWATNPGDKALITALMNRINTLSGKLDLYLCYVE